MLSRIQSCSAIACLVLAAASVVHLQAQVCRGAETPSIEQIVATLEKQREQVKSLSIETREYGIFPVDVKVQSSWPELGPIDPTYWDEKNFAFKGGKRYQKLVQSTEKKSAESSEFGSRRITLNTEQGDDSESCWERRVDLKRGPAQVFVNPCSTKSKVIQIPDYCRRIGWDCTTEMFTQDESLLKDHRANDMLSLLKKGAYTIKERMSEVNGAKCVVIQREYETTIASEDGKSRPPVVRTTEKIWLDLDHALAVRQRERHTAMQAIGRLVNSDFVEVLPGIWFPKKTEEQVFAPPSAPPDFQGRLVRSYYLDLIRWTVNAVPDERFTVTTKPSDVLWDNRTGVRRVIQGPDELAESTTESDNPPRPKTTNTHANAAPAVLPSELVTFVAALAVDAAADRSDAAQVRVAVVSVENCDPAEILVSLLESNTRCTCETVTSADIHAGALKRNDVVLFPGGDAHAQGDALGNEGRRAVRQFVKEGGGYVGICAGATLATNSTEWCLGLIDVKTQIGRRDSPGPDGIMSVDMGDRGNGTVKMELTDVGRKVLGGPSGLLDAAFRNGPIFLPAEKAGPPKFVGLAHYRAEVWLHSLQRGTMIASPNILAARFDEGRVILFSSHPEARQDTKSMLLRAVLATARKSADRNQSHKSCFLNRRLTQLR